MITSLLASQTQLLQSLGQLQLHIAVSLFDCGQELCEIKLLFSIAWLRKPADVLERLFIQVPHGSNRWDVS